MEKRVRTRLWELGCRSYREVWEMQERFFEEARKVKEAGKPAVNRLLFVEHDPVYTLGKSGNEDNMLLDAVRLRTRHVELLRVDRGGDITFHGPGQWVVYPIIDLEQFGLGVKDYVYCLEEVVIRAIARYGIRGERLAGATGVWVEPNTPRARKICAIGVKCSRHMTMHGLALNVNTDLRYFNYIHPCGFVDKGVTSVSKETGGKELSMMEVREFLLRSFEEVMGMVFV
ncbi:MAG: lipoyl(octanoyl) transferase LipB [Odoribacter sp.]|nr:lipoyl(octanoyl) transferase LipB [Odoribacter sp.]